MKGLCSYCSRYFFCSKRPKQNEEDVILCSSFTQNMVTIIQNLKKK